MDRDSARQLLKGSKIHDGMEQAASATQPSATAFSHLDTHPDADPEGMSMPFTRQKISSRLILNAMKEAR